MSNEEFSNGMDVALNSYSFPANFGEGASRYNITLDEYEKSVFLTKAEYEIFTNLYNGKNIYGDFFEGTEELRRYLDSLVRTKEYSLDEAIKEYTLQPVNIDGTNTIKKEYNYLKISNNSKVFELPKDLAFITFEQVTYDGNKDECLDGYTAKVYPVTQDEYDRVKNNPFRGPTRYKALRLDYGKNWVEIISKYSIGKYYIKYLKKPNPIVLVDLPGGLNIKGVTTVSKCDMNPLLHDLILNRAVALAVQSKSISINNNSNKSD